MVTRRDKLDVPISGRVSVEKYRTLEAWRMGSYRKRSEVISIVLDRVLEILEQGGGRLQPVESFVRRLRVDPPA